MLNTRSERARKIKIAWIIIKEILFMALGIVSCLLPTTWRIGILIFIGMRSILLEARIKLREAKEKNQTLPEPKRTREITNIEKDKRYQTATNKKTGGKAGEKARKKIEV